MKKLLFLIISAMILFNGCALKQAIKQDPIYEKTLKQTRRAQIVNSLETKALIDAVNLNDLYPKKFQKPTFLIGIYNNQSNAIQNMEFSIFLNSKKPVRVSKIIPTFIPYKNYPFYNSWMTYYIVTFNNTQKPYLLEYKSAHWGETKITF